MRNKNVFCLLLILILPLAGISQEQPQMTEESKKMMEVWMKYAMPSEAHKKIMAMAGSYSITSKSRMDPVSPFMESSGTCEKKAVLGDRWIQEHCNGTAMANMPPFEGFGMMGYDNYKQQYEMHWFDNMSTMGFTMKGTADAAGKVITMKGTYEDPMTKKTKTGRWVWTIMDANKQKLELFDQDKAGKEFLSTEINYTRK
jgi:Protein of unknown function (DUF1579)